MRLKLKDSKTKVNLDKHPTLNRDVLLEENSRNMEETKAGDIAQTKVESLLRCH